MLQRFFAALEANGDAKCYCPCRECRGFNGRRLPLKIVEKHCRENGHIEGGIMNIVPW